MAPDGTHTRPVRFQDSLAAHGVRIDRRPLEILQVNIGKLCNQACHHCHVEAGPKRTEMMAGATVERILGLLADAPAVHTVDITGGAPELNPHFRTLAAGARALGKTVIDRCNLTVLYEPGQEDTAEWLAAHGISIVASLPCYGPENVEKQRGKGVFDKSIEGLRWLNRLGYGQEGSALSLDLVYNPVGPSLPPPQAKLEADYKRELDQRFGIRFHRLYTITNMPIARFLHDLRRDGKLDAYMDLLVGAFNPHAAEGVMCRNLLSVSWDGRLFDCDFNQMLEIPLGAAPRTLWDIERLDQLDRGAIAFAGHCYGCTAGAGSSCGGALA
ncbi:MAG TPA: arsenosugar biosynthesis radical SAM protein ArsS [Xanthomonadaceae bacterium]|nr:arsenosugar biosynthesis radical SAM protein ArsS [Xanthomonadaceae bacterium]